MTPDVLPEAPRELTTSGPLRRIGEGIGRVVFASPCWVVKRERTHREVLALIVLWRILRTVERALPFTRGFLTHPSRQLRALRLLIEAVILIIPRTVWFSTHIVPVWRTYYRRSTRGARLAREYLAGSGIVPRTVTFPPVRVRVRGWPGWLVVTEAEERAEATLLDRLSELARDGFFDEFEEWLDRYLALRRSGWARGLFSTDAHLKNFGIIGDRLVLLDPGGLTNRWSEIADKLQSDRQTSAPPHVRLGLAPLLVARPDIARRFDLLWQSTVQPKVVREYLASAT
jgi:hypothetical protein